MTVTSATIPHWTDETRRGIRQLQDGLRFTAQWAQQSGADASVTELLLQPYREMIETLYERDLPLAKLADGSDLLLHVHGPAATGPSPRVSVLSRLLTHTRDQVTRLAKQIAGVTTIRVPTSLDMDFVGVAGGSLFIGFSAEATEGGELTRQAVKAIADASWLIAENKTIAELAETIEDPAARDMAVAAVRHLSPSGQMGIREINILGRQVARTTALTTETRRLARGIMSQRLPEATERVTFIGTVREVDLDASRFEIRNVEGQIEDVRCAHELEEDEVKRLVDKRVRVSGTPEYGAKKTVRLLWIDEVELLA
jgi:hypothetical protein